MKTLRLILGDQLNHAHSWFTTVRDDVVYCLFEMRQETDYASHHIQKVIAFFAAMRAFAEHLKNGGHEVVYLKLDDPDNAHQLPANLDTLVARYNIQHFEYLLPDEWRLDEQLRGYCGQLSISSKSFDTEHFLAAREDMANFFGTKHYLMESFYRHMRRRYNILIDDANQPLTGQWNYDQDNRQKMPHSHQPPEPLLFEKNVSHLVDLLQTQQVATIGEVQPEAFVWPVTRQEALQLLEFFCEQLLPHFGDFQDAMTPHYWALYHSRLSFAMNVKLLSPLEVVQKAIAAWQQQPSEISFAQLEGFVRQIIGWREYMRGVYWARMPQYAELNFFGHSRALPQWFWTGQTNMACLRHAVGQSLQYAYAHHIQRLMVTGNFALLSGIHPDEVDAWYLGIYIDAIEWVEITNTRGMSQFADGGIVGTKPYCSSAAYLHKMGHYCEECYYNRKIRTGERACPFNSLYWHFHARNRELLERNPRIGMVFRTWDKMTPATQSETLAQAEYYLDKLNEL